VKMKNVNLFIIMHKYFKMKEILIHLQKFMQNFIYFCIKRDYI
jgi:hypothetical protein